MYHSSLSSFVHVLTLVIPAKAGIQPNKKTHARKAGIHLVLAWTPAFAGVTIGMAAKLPSKNYVVNPIYDIKMIF